MKQEQEKQGFHLTTISYYPSHPSTGESTSSPLPFTLSRSPSFQSQKSNSSSLSSSSSVPSKGVLGNKLFAPPPPFPTSLEVTKSKLYPSLEKKVVKSSLPPYHEIKHSGQVLARFSIKSRLTQRWRPTFWIVQGRHKVLFFRSKSDFDEWAANPYLTTQERNELIKLTLDFVNDAYKAGINNLKGYRATEIRSKFIKRESNERKMASHFRVERWTSRAAAAAAAGAVGGGVPSTLVVIGGKEAGQVGALHTLLVEMIRSSGNEYRPPPGSSGSHRGDDASLSSSYSMVDGGRGRAWDLRSNGSMEYGSSIGYSFSNLSYVSSNLSDEPGESNDYQMMDSRDDLDWDREREDTSRPRHMAHEEEPQQYQQQQQQQQQQTHRGVLKNTLFSSSSFENLGSRIMMRMRSRSPSTRARRLKELEEQLQEQNEPQQQQQQQTQMNAMRASSSPSMRRVSTRPAVEDSWSRVSLSSMDHGTSRRQNPPSSNTPNRQRPPLAPNANGSSSSSIPSTIGGGMGSTSSRI